MNLWHSLNISRAYGSREVSNVPRSAARALALQESVEASRHQGRRWQCITSRKSFAICLINSLLSRSFVGLTTPPTARLSVVEQLVLPAQILSDLAHALIPQQCL